ncbi:MAG: acetyl-CoA carboxylase biotin carboxylase subunit [Flavobacteriales bacterium]|nr:MAG: acetyl-CoA carboxylase biotin carboxylase subunit [Flavobacteriales bacterium]
MNKLLVANRGEIALRIMKTAREMGLKTVAVYSEADALSPHVRYADEAVCIGPPASGESYLRMDKILEVAKITGADAIHPGYGFLSENAVFADEVQKAGIIFVGPNGHSMRKMGDKLSAKEAVAHYDIPLVPGSDGEVTDTSLGREIANSIGYPVLIKASAGGGGKGMRIVNREEDVEEQMNLAINEARSAFGNGAVFIEKFVEKPRHIEIQVLADKHGNVVHLFERECSIQRRHQKVIEEAPSSVLTPELRKKMGEAAVKVAKACDYIGAGTVEFLVDKNLDYYFLEMNTRLQVEHPVTEMITGLDLVREQIRVAMGEKLGYDQDSLQIFGHAIEARVYAEDPRENFMPSTGKLSVYQLPSGPGVRVDDGFEQGMQVPIYYDPMLSKLIVHAATREQAMDRMIRVCNEYQIHGIQHTLPFVSYVMKHPAFRSGDFDTNFVKDLFIPEELDSISAESAEEAALVVAHLLANESVNSANPVTSSSENYGISNWKINRKR